MNGPSPHLSWQELACHDRLHTPYPLDYRTDGRVRRLALTFEAIRQAAGGHPISILSAYRTPAYNALTPGAAQSSQHVQGRALDLQTPTHLTLGTFWAIVQDVARLVPAIGGLGVYDWGCHVDIRPRVDGRVAVWDLRSAKPGTDSLAGG